MNAHLQRISTVCGLWLSTLTALPAATHVWSGNGINDLFSNAANWSAGGVPSAGESGVLLLQFPANSGSLTPLDNISGLAVDGITFAGGGYVLRGSGAVSLTLRRSSGVSITCTVSGGLPDKIESTLPLVIASTTRVLTDFSLLLDSAISGIGGLRIEAGDVHLRGAASNTYAFTTAVPGGTLWLEKPDGLASIGGDLLINGGVVRNQRDYQLGNTETITLSNNGYYIPGSFQEDLPDLHFDHGTLQLTGSSGVILYGDVTVSALGGTISGVLGLKEPARTIHVDAAGTLSAGKLADRLNLPAGLTKTGPGNLVLLGLNTFTGDVTVVEGSFLAQTSAALGVGTGATSVGAGAQLLFQGSGLSFSNKSLNLAGTFGIYSDVAWNGPITLFGAASGFGGGTGPGGPLVLTHGGVISGAGKLNKGGSFRMVLAGSAANTHTGGTLITGGEMTLGKSSGNAIPGGLQLNAGQLSLTASHQISDTSAVVINGGILDMGARVDTIGSLSGTGGEVKFALGTLTAGDAGDTTWSGLLSGYGPNSLIKQGAGNFTLNNTADGGDTLTGPLVVNQGTLQMDGLHSGPIIVAPGGLLTGSGTVGQIQAMGGRVCLCALKTTNLIITGAGSEADTAIHLGGYGHIITSNAILTGSTLNASLHYVPYAGSSFVLIENTGSDATVGTFAGMPEGAAVNFGSQIFNITYQGGTGNDVVLTLVSGGLPPFSVDKFTSSSVPGNAGANAVLIEATGQPGVKHVIESSNDMVFWNVINAIPVTSDALGHSSTAFMDDNPDHRFYRVKEVLP